MEAALPVFGRRGFHAASTVEIAEAAGISQAYLFRLFPTKVDLFVAAADEGSRRMLATFREASEQAGHGEGEQLEAMGKAYTGLVERDRDVLLIQLQSQVASPAEPKIREGMQKCFRQIYELVSSRAEAGARGDEGLVRPRDALQRDGRDRRRAAARAVGPGAGGE